MSELDIPKLRKLLADATGPFSTEFKNDTQALLTALPALLDEVESLRSSKTSVALEALIDHEKELEAEVERLREWHTNENRDRRTAYARIDAALKAIKDRDEDCHCISYEDCGCAVRALDKVVIALAGADE